MQFLLLIVILLSCVQRRWPAPADWLGVVGSHVLTWGVVALLVFAAWLTAQFWRRRIQRDTFQRSNVLRRFAFFRRWHTCVLIVAYFCLVCFGGWGWMVGDTLVHGNIVTPGTDIVMLLPLFVGMTLSWASYYPLELALASSGSQTRAETFPSRWSYVALQSRNTLLLVAPPLVLMFLNELIIALWPELLHNQTVLPLIGVALLVAMYVGVPWLLRLLLGLKSMPDGPLRQRLMSTAKRLSFRFSDIVVWNTRGTVVNAMVTGPLPMIRYVILTDRLIEELEPDEIEAVFGHEVGHIKHQHLFFYFAFLVASLLAVLASWELFLRMLEHFEVPIWVEENLPGVNEWLNSYQVITALPVLFGLGAYIVFVFGYLSRRCERQADIFGCRTASVPVFIAALEKVARCNGISRDRPGWLQSWQHATIAQRVEFLETMQVDPTLEARFQRRVGVMKWGTLFVLAGLLIVLTVTLGAADVLMILGN